MPPSHLEFLKSLFWEEGTHIPLAPMSYRQRVVIACSSYGRQTAEFLNGPHKYFAYVELLNSRGEWIKSGAVIIPVLPDGRLILIAEQRPVIARYDDQKFAENFHKFANIGPYSSLEFPSGGIEPGERIVSGFLRELTEESEVDRQKVLVYRTNQHVYMHVSDLCLTNFFAVVFLSRTRYSEKVENDGGLTVLALDHHKIRQCIFGGILAGGHSILGYYFYQEVMKAKISKLFLNELTASGYLSIEELEIR